MIPNEELNILLVEDSPSDAELAKLAFTNSSFKSNVNHAKDGVEALAMLRCEGSFVDYPRPDLIFLDLNMPRKDGRQVLHELRMDKALITIPVIMMTTSRDETDVQDCYRLGTNSYIVKPVELQDFFQLIEETQHYWRNISILPPRL